jgi:hypothetical protein
MKIKLHCCGRVVFLQSTARQLNMSPIATLQVLSGGINVMIDRTNRLMTALDWLFWLSRPEISLTW